MTRTAIITDRTPSRATVVAFIEDADLGPSDEELEAAGLDRMGGGAAWDLLAIEDEDAKVGDRVWLS